MIATEDRKTCIDCEHFDIMVGNIDGVCIIESYINGDGDLCLQWLPYDAAPCERFKEIEP